jgi:hypothetical protein
MTSVRKEAAGMDGIEHPHDFFRVHGAKVRVKQQ